MNVGKMAAVVLVTLAAWPGCASQKSTLESGGVPTLGRAQDASLAAIGGNAEGALTARDIDTVRRFLCGRARSQLVLLESEMTRVARRLEQEGTDAQRTEWVPVLSDIDHDRRVLAAGLLEAEEAPAEEWAEVHAILPSLIDVLTFVSAQTMAAIDEALDTHAAPQESSGSPHGA